MNFDIPPDPKIIPRPDLGHRHEDKREPLPAPRAHTVPGKTTAQCTCCGENRERTYRVYGPLKFAEINRELREQKREIKPRCSDHPAWKKFWLAWLVSPPNPPREGGYYEIYLVVRCTNRKCDEYDIIYVEDHFGYRQFGLIGKWKIQIQSVFGIESIIRPARSGFVVLEKSSTKTP
jgi:hypothetical protein